MARIPDQAENRRQFAALEAPQRRAIIRSVNRGRAVAVRRHAPIAVGVARRQQRFWRWSWLLGPVVGGLQALFTEPAVALANAAVATAGLVLLSLWFGMRARRAEQLDLEVAAGRRSPGDDRIQRGRGGDPSGGRGPRVPAWLRRWWPWASEGHEQAASGGQSRGDAHLPRRPGSAPPAAAEPEHPSEDGRPGRTRQPAPEPLIPGRRPYQPRRRKRRR